MIAERYERFARSEAAGRSPLYEKLALHIANSPPCLSFLARLPEEKQQPNLLFAALRMAAGLPTSADMLEAMLDQHQEAIAAIMLSRTTQTNEPGRCAALMPALCQLEGPIALIEVGASAGLCLLPDCYGYIWEHNWGAHHLAATEVFRQSAPVFPCKASQNTPRPMRHPDIVWRAGLDLNPLDLSNEENVNWLQALVWPEHEGRLERLKQALIVARQQKPPVFEGNLLKDLPALIEEAPKSARLVVFHTAVLSYVGEQSERDAFARQMMASNAVWLCNESPRVFPQFSAGLVSNGAGRFLLTRNGEALAWTGPHGQSVDWIGSLS